MADAALIPLTKGQYAVVDAVDYEYLSQWKWHTSYYGYAERRQHIKSTRNNQKFKMIKMHRLIMKTPDNLVTDHINGNKLDNRRSNLRTCSQHQNTANQRLRASNTSGYKGVIKQGERWTAQIKINYKHYYLGRFDEAIEAARAYNAKAQEVWGEYAKLNDC